jgi:hypothetical protein
MLRNYNVPFSCDLGDVVRLFADFTTIDGMLLDPQNITVFVKSPTGIVVQYTSEIIRTGVGQYYLDVITTTSGTWCYRWEATGTGQCAAEQTFMVKESLFAPVSFLRRVG